MFNTIRAKILAGNAVLLVILLVVSIFSLNELHSNQKLLEAEEHAFVDLKAIDDIEKKFLEYRAIGTEFMVLMQNKEKTDRDRIFGELHEALKSSKQENIGSLVGTLEKINSQLLSATTAFINDDRIEGALSLNASSKLSAQMLATLESLSEARQEDVNRIVEEVHSSNHRVSFSLYLILGVMVVVGAGISLFLANMVSRPLAMLQATIEHIEGNGDLTERAKITSRDEVGHLAEAFNSLIDKLANIVSEVTHQSTRVATAAQQLSAVTENTSQGVLRQSGEIQQVATAMTQMSATVSDVANNATHASSSAHEGNEEAIKGNQVVSNTISAIGELAEDVEGSSTVIQRLKDDSQNIGTVLDVIKNIAEQTNLLALNAAIEAARAGEQGRGFAVVADEVRTLARRTQDSTEEIENLIETLQSGAEEAVQVMNKSRDRASNTVSQAKLAGQSLEAITSAVGRILDVNTQIASAAEQQAVTAEEINRNITNIQMISDETAAGATQTAGASTELSELGEELRGLVGNFKV